MKKLVDMKRSMSEKKVLEVDAFDTTYPYGLEISLDHEALKKLGIDSLPKAGARMRLAAVAVVINTEDRTRQRGKKTVHERSMRLQLQKIALSKNPANMEEAVDDGVAAAKK